MSRPLTRALSLVILLGFATASAPTLTGRASVIDRFLRAPVGTIPVKRFTGRVREFTLEVRRIRAEIAPGVKVEQWAFGFPGQPPTVPGPELRVKQGDLVRVTLHNTLDQPHTIHLHGITSLAQRMAGNDTEGHPRDARHGREAAPGVAAGSRTDAHGTECRQPAGGGATVLAVGEREQGVHT